MATLPDQIAGHRAALLRQERAAASAMVRAYGQAWQRLQARLDELQRRVAAARAAGETISPAWLAQEERLQLLLRQVEAELRVFARVASEVIRQEQRRAIAAAVANGHTLIRAETPALAIVNTRALEALVGALGDGSPLSTLLDTIAPQGAAAAAEALTTGLITGQNPAVTARELRDALGIGLARALTISRTETLRVYREATLATYQANADVVEGWIWVAALSRRTCPVCIAMHGRVFPLSVPFASHPNCRCTPAPKVRSRPSPFLPGPQWFGLLPAVDQEAILGPAKFARFAAGVLQLADLVGEKPTRYGPTRYELPLDAIAA